MTDPSNLNHPSLSDFIRANLECILVQWEQFARSIPSARHLDAVALRDHAIGILFDIADDLEQAQTAQQRAEKAKGKAPHHGGETQAERHGADRVALGFSVNDTISEFRALRASVLQFWDQQHGSTQPIPGEEMIRFNEAVDQALTESLERYAIDKEEATRRFDSLLSSSPDLQCIIAIDGTLIYANKALLSLFGSSTQELLGKKISELPPELAGPFAEAARQVLEKCEPCRGEIPCRSHGSDTVVTYRYVLMPVLNEEGKIDSLTGTGRNISELKASEEKILRSAYYDFLTDLPNRMLFRDRLDHDVKHAARTGNTLALMFIDLDGFKEVNDRYGHAAGDQLLRQVAARISACVRATDTVARIGGDEFTVILTDVNHVSHIEILAQQILDALARLFTVQDKDVHISGSIGITLCPQDARLPDDLVRNADQAMFVAKNAGRNRFSFFTAEMRDSAWARLKVIDELRHALAQHQLSVYFQPIVDLRSGAIVKAEALVRWHHPQGRLVLPGDFIGLAEETGLIGEIDALVVAEAVAYARRWSEQIGTLFQISINKSPVEFMGRSLAKGWEAELDLLALAGSQIAVEITEGVMLNDSPAVRERLLKMQQLGVQFTVDDFGIGYSSMAYLKKFKVDYLKIDQSFIRDMMTSPESSIFVETIIDMAHKLGLKVIAEGVETDDQRDSLRVLGCDYGQGFLFAAAATWEQFEQMLGVRNVNVCG